MRGAVIIAKSDQGTNLKQRFASAEIARDLILNRYAVLAARHQNGLFDYDAGYTVEELRKRFRSKRFQIRVAVGMNRARVLVRAQFKALAIQHQRLFQFRKQNQSPDGRLRRRHQQSMIAAGVQSNDGGRSESADAVGLQPFARGRLGHVAANSVIEFDLALLWRWH